MVLGKLTSIHCAYGHNLNFFLFYRSPLSDNDCSKQKYILEDHLTVVTDLTQAQVDRTDNRCVTQLTNAVDTQAMNDDLMEVVPAPNECYAEDFSSQRIGDLLWKLDRAMQMKKRITNDLTYEDRQWQTTKDFDETWINDIEQHQSKLISVADVRANKVWFHYLKNELEPEISR